MKKTILFILGIIIGAILLFTLINFKSTCNYLGINISKNDSTESNTDISSNTLKDVEEKAISLSKYAAKNGYDTSVFFLIDMKLSSGKDRFFVYDGIQKKIKKSALVTHGSCYEKVLVGRKYSNVVGGGCTSLGRYKIGNPYQGKFGLAYKMYGLDTSNNNAFERFVVLHSHACVPDAEVHPYPICLSEGCPTVSPKFLNELAKIIDNSAKPVLMEIFDTNFQ